MRIPPNAPNPVLVEFHRGPAVESVHRGSWVLCNGGGEVLEGAGDWTTPVFPRSAVKALQALPLIESGAADRFGFDAGDLALAVSSHNGEPCHTERAAAILGRIGLDEAALRCGAHPPTDRETADALRGEGSAPTQLHNNCSGKHSGFLALATHLDADRERYLDPEGPTQHAVRAALADMARVDGASLDYGIDGCSAPNWRLPLRSLATAFARFATPEAGADLAAERASACTRILDGVAAHPALIAGHRRRVCTEIARVTGGRLFPKIGAEAVYVVGARGADRALAIKMDDGSNRGLHPLLIELLGKLGFVSDAELGGLEGWRNRALKNYAGLEVGAVEVRLG